MIATMVERANADPKLARRFRFLDLAFEVGVGGECWLVEISQRSVAARPRTAGKGREPAFSLRADAESWAEFAKPVPPPGYNDILAMFEGGNLELDGEMLPLFRNLLSIKALLDKLRATEARS
jgi:hypothetical protein